LGATRLTELSARLEKASEPQSWQVDEVSDEFQSLCDTLRSVLTVPPPQSAPPADDGQTGFLRAARTLEALLANDDLAAGEAFRRSEAVLRAALGPAADRLAVDLEAFNYEAALAGLRGAMGGLSGGPKAGLS
jgi:hypothetical protein